jgi:hypothetical protein
MRDGDRAGGVVFRDTSASIGIHNSGSISALLMANNRSLGSNWVTQSKGSVAATGPAVTGLTLYLRIAADITPAFNQNRVRQAILSCSTDGSSFAQFGLALLLYNTRQYFTG